MKLEHIQLVKEMIDKGYISVRKHPEFDLYIYNYTKQATAEHVWNEATESCRGIICDKDQNVVARPFVKFYNYEELLQQGKQIPDLPFEVYEKLDGSLGVLYFYNGKPYIATRGSFDSSQAKHATKVLYSKYSNKFDLLDQSKTYLFEIIYKDPNTSLVVNYGDTDDIFLIAVIDTDTGFEDDIYKYKHIFKTTTKYESVKDYLSFRKDQNGYNREGFVIKFSNGFRMKLKFEEYFKAHSAQFHLNIKSAYKAILENKVDKVRLYIDEHLSEESALYFDELVKSVYIKYKDIENECLSEFRDDFKSRNEAAQYFLKCKYPKILFQMYDRKNYSKLIWKLVEKEL